MHGLATDLSCRPILNWSTDDVFAYLSALDLPIHPVYAMTADGAWTRDDLRVDVLGDEPGQGRGRRSWELTYYGDILSMMGLF